jgi:hypothetical protein
VIFFYTYGRIPPTSIKVLGPGWLVERDFSFIYYQTLRSFSLEGYISHYFGKYAFLAECLENRNILWQLLQTFKILKPMTSSLLSRALYFTCVSWQQVSNSSALSEILQLVLLSRDLNVCNSDKFHWLSTVLVKKENHCLHF